MNLEQNVDKSRKPYKLRRTSEIDRLKHKIHLSNKGAVKQMSVLAIPLNSIAVIDDKKVDALLTSTTKEQRNLRKDKILSRAKSFEKFMKKSES